MGNIPQGDRSSRSHPTTKDRKRMQFLDRKIGKFKNLLKELDMLRLDSLDIVKKINRLDRDRKELRHKMKHLTKT